VKPQGLDRNVVTQRLVAMRRFLDHLDRLDQPSDDPFADYGRQLQVERILGDTSGAGTRRPRSLPVGPGERRVVEQVHDTGEQSGGR